MEVIDLREAMEGTNVPPAASENYGGGDALEAIIRLLDGPIPKRIFLEESETEPGVMQVDPAGAARRRGGATRGRDPAGPGRRRTDTDTARPTGGAHRTSRGPGNRRNGIRAQGRPTATSGPALQRPLQGVGDPAEAVRIADDALSLVKDMTFLGQASKKVNNPRKPDLEHMSMPIKLEFDDRNSRIHFERTMLDKCNIKASMSLPKPVRTALNKFHDNLKIRYPDEITMARVDTYKLRFIAFHKEDGGPKWEPCPEWLAIPLDILKDGNAPPAGTGDSGCATPMVVG